MAIVNVNGFSLLVTGKLLKLGSIYDEYWIKNEATTDPNHVISCIKNSSCKIDIYTFSQKLPEIEQTYEYCMEWDNVAAIRITTFDEWWKQLPQATRKNVRRSAKRGVHISVVPFDDQLVKGIVDIYNETPIRQGRRFIHYGKTFDIVKQENSTYLSNSDFIGAYLDQKLVGFLKIVYVEKEAKIMQIIAMAKHQDKRIVNALIAKAVEICAQRQVDYFIYGKYIYGNRTNVPIIEFKNRNGFAMMKIPKYFVPLTLFGNLALRLRLHHGFMGLVPQPIKDQLINIRTNWNERNLKSATQECDDNSNE